MVTPVKEKQPRALYTLFFAEMWERFSFYGMRALLILYMTREILYSDDHAYGVYAAYGALVYTTPFLGGLLADNILGYRKSVILGGILMAIGHFLMAIQSQPFFYSALAFLIIGNGFFKPNISSMVGGLYGKDDVRRDAGFTIFYMGVNLGALLAPLVCGIIGEGFGWHYGFSLAGIGMIIGLVVFWKGQYKLGEQNGIPPYPEKLKQKVLPGLSLEKTIYLVSFLIIPLIAYVVFNYEAMDYILNPFAIIVLGGLLYYAFKSNKIDRERIFVIIILTIFSIVFWAFFEQAGSSITLFTARNVDRSIFGFTIPASVFQSVNPLFIVALGPLFSTLWIKLGKINKEPSTPLKFSLGLIQLGLGFGALVLGARTAGEDGLSGLFFLILGYLLHTTGELCLSPVGLSMVTKLSPKKIVAMVMGAWFLSSAMAHHIGGTIASLTSTSAYMESSILYETPLYKEGSTKFTVNVYDKDSLVSENLTVNILMGKDSTSRENNSALAKTKIFKRYISMKPGTKDTINLEIKNLDPTGNLMKINPPSNQEVLEENKLIYHAPDNATIDTLRYNLCYVEYPERCQEVELIITVDTIENHPPVAITQEISLEVEKRKLFSKFLGQAEYNINVLDYFYDPVGDELNINILEKPDSEYGYITKDKALSSFVTPAKTIHIYSRVLFIITLFAIGAGLVLLLLVPILRKWMHGVH